MAQTLPSRYIGLDIHKYFLVATGVNQEQEQVFGPQRVSMARLEGWIKETLKPTDAVVLEMTTNTWATVDALEPFVHSVTVVHPPHVRLITRAQVMTDKKAALILAQLHAAGLLPGIWVPTPAVRDLRALVAQRWKMVRLGVQAKNRLQSVLHRHHIQPPEKVDLYAAATREWWLNLPVSASELMRIHSDLDTLAFSQEQIKKLVECLAKLAARDERVPLLVQIPGIGLITAMTILAAIGDIERFPTAKQLVGYAGLGARIHDSGESSWRGRITKAGRRDLRSAMVEAAQSAVRSNTHWKAEFQRLEQRIGRKKAIVAVARKLLVTVWYVLSGETADRFATEQQVACSLFALAYKIGVANLPDGLSAKGFTRQQLDRLGIGQELQKIPWGRKQVTLPPSQSAM